jgi:histidinol phosphatase-like PHP family hydrolase
MLIRHNLHQHTNLSTCGHRDATVEGVIRSAEAAGLERLAITDHLSAPDKDREQQFFQRTEELTRIDHEIDVLLGAEICMPHIGWLPASDEFLEWVSFLFVAVNHYGDDRDQPKTRDEEGYAAHHVEMLHAAIDLKADVVAHPFTICGAKNPLDRDKLEESLSKQDLRGLFRAAANTNMAFEFNMTPGKRLSDQFVAEIISLAQSVGTKFTFGSDGHDDPSAGYGGERGPREQLDAHFASLGLTEDDILQNPARQPTMTTAAHGGHL